jgi:hypothetical protein
MIILDTDHLSALEYRAAPGELSDGPQGLVANDASNCHRSAGARDLPNR